MAFPTSAVLEDPTPLDFAQGALATATALASQESVPHILTGLYNSSAHRNLLIDWRTEEKTLRFRMHRKEQNLSSAEAEIYQIVGIFSLFQGVFFSALAQTSVLKCKDWFSPFLMSFLVFLATYGAIEQKIRAFAEIEKELTRARQEAEALYECIDKLMLEGSNYNLNRLDFEPRVRCPVDEDNSDLGCNRLFKRILTRALIVRVLVIALSTIVLVSCPKILCRGCTCPH